MEIERKHIFIAAWAIAVGVAAAIVFKKRYYIMDKAKLALMGRTIDKIIIHCSATYPTQQCNAAIIDKWHVQRGFSQIGYNYVILQNGTVELGRSLELVGAHCTGHNSDSIGICYVGGLNASGQPEDTRTDAQKKALKNLISQIRAKYGNIPVYGHRDFNSAKSCPCFDAKNEYN